MSAVRVRHRPPAFAREASEGCRAEARRAKAGPCTRELRLGKPLAKMSVDQLSQPMAVDADVQQGPIVETLERPQRGVARVPAADGRQRSLEGLAQPGRCVDMR